MKRLRIDLLIADEGWKGTGVRVVGMLIAYVGIKYLPTAIDWGVVNFNISPLSPKQVENHGAIVTVFGWAFFVAVTIEIIRWMVVVVRRFR